MNDSDIMLSLKKGLRVRQDCGLLPCEGERRFHVMASEIGMPVFRALVTSLCIEGLSVHLLMAFDQTPAYVGIEIAEPHTFLCLWPGPGNHEFTSNLQAGAHMSSINDLIFRKNSPEHSCLGLQPVPQPFQTERVAMRDTELTIDQAASILNTSNEWVDGLIRDRSIPCRMVDGRPVLMLSDVTRYKTEIDAKRRAVLDELTSAAERMGFYESR